MSGPWLVGPETERLRHRAFGVDDAEAFHALNSDPEVMRLTGEPPSESVEAARAAIAAYPDFRTVGYGRWACVLKSTDEIVGFCGLKYLPELGVTDLGFRFRPRFQGRGLATEAGRATLEFGFGTVGLSRVVGLVLPANTASIHVLDKLGFCRDGTVEYEGHRVLRFVAAREDWTA